MADEKIIHSLDEIEKSAKESNNEFQKNKNWLMKSLELISAETVLKNIKKGDKVLKKLSDKSSYVKKMRKIQEALGYYYFAYYRSKNKDKRALKGIEEQKEIYKKEIEIFIKENIEKKEAYSDKEFHILFESIQVLECEKHHEAANLGKIIYENRIAYQCYINFLTVNYTNINDARKDYKDNLTKNTKLIRILNTEIRNLFKKNIDKAESWIIDEDKLKKINKKEIKKILKYISYFNTNAYNKYTDIINKFFLANLITSFMENDLEYNNYDQLNKFSEKYIQLLNQENSNEIVNNAISNLKKVIKVYNESYVEHQFSLLFESEIPNKDIINKIYLVEKLINDYEEEKVIKYLNEIWETLKIKNLGEKLFKIESHIKTGNLIDISFKDKIVEFLNKIHQKLSADYNISGKFKLKIENLGNDHTYILFNKSNIDIGRSRTNDIIINSQYISNQKHLSIDVETNNLYNGFKTDLEKDKTNYNMTFVNNDGNDKITELNLYNDKIYEINLGHAFTFKIPEKNDNFFTLEPFEDKSNPTCSDAYIFNKFKNTKYIFLKKIKNIYLDKEEKKVSSFEEENMFEIEFKDSKIFLINLDSIPRIITEGENILDKKYKITFQILE